MATIKDIAKKANVAASTVSYVLNDTKSVKPETKEKILKIVEEMNYHPSQVARSLKTKKTLTIGIIIPDISNMFFTEIIRGIEDVANSFEYNVVLCNTDEDQQKEKRYLNNLINKNIDGLIFVGTGKNSHIFERRQNMPVVMVDRKLGYNFPSVMVNNIAGGFEATNYLLGKNASQVLLLTGPLSISTYFDRMTGYIDALRSRRFDYNELYVQECPVSLDGGYNAIDGIFEKGIQVKSIFASNDLIALGALKALLKRGINVPGEISLVGYDDIPTSSIVTPSLTTVEQPKYLMGEKAAQLLLEQIADKEVEDRHIVLEPRLIIRETA